MVVIDFIRQVVGVPARMLAARRAALDAQRSAPPLPPAHWEDEMLYMLPPFY